MLAFSSSPRELSENQNSTPDWNRYDAKITTSKVGIAEISEKKNTSWVCSRPVPPSVSAARRSAIRRPSRTSRAIAGTSVPISRVAVTADGISSRSDWARMVAKVTTVIARKTTAAITSITANRLARRAATCTRRHQRGKPVRRTRPPLAPAAAAPG